MLAVGIRGENRSADYQDTDGAAFSPDETMYGGSVSLRHDFSARTQGYVKFARGYKAGGFNIGSQVPADKRSFVAESLQNLELGMRASNEDASLAGDIALFYMRRYDQQVPAGEQLEPGNPLSFVLYTDNAASGENYGLEATLAMAPDGLTTARPACGAARDPVYRLRFQRSRPRRSRTGARAAVPVRPGHRILPPAWLVSRAWILPASTISISTCRTTNARRREC